MGRSLTNIAWQQRMTAAGRCRTCGRSNPVPAFKRCPACRRRDRVYQRLRRGWNEWRPGGPGRPPKTD